AVGDRVEHAAHAARLLGPRHTFEAEVGGAFVAHVGRVQARWTHSIRSGIARSVRRAIVVAFSPARCAESPPLRGSCARRVAGIEVSGPLFIWNAVRRRASRERAPGARGSAPTSSRVRGRARGGTSTR